MRPAPTWAGRATAALVVSLALLAAACGEDEAAGPQQVAQAGQAKPSEEPNRDLSGAAPERSTAGGDAPEAGAESRAGGGLREHALGEPDAGSARPGAAKASPAAGPSGGEGEAGPGESKPAKKGKPGGAVKPGGAPLPLPGQVEGDPYETARRTCGDRSLVEMVPPEYRDAELLARLYADAFANGSPDAAYEGCLAGLRSLGY
jgi:hypothetical protein